MFFFLLLLINELTVLNGCAESFIQMWWCFCWHSGTVLDRFVFMVCFSIGICHLKEKHSVLTYWLLLITFTSITHHIILQILVIYTAMKLWCI